MLLAGGKDMDLLIDPKVTELGVKSVGVIMTGVDNKTISPEYEAYRKQAVQNLIERCCSINVKEDPIVEGFYKLHDKVHVKRRKNPPSMETLIKYIQKKEDLPHINKVVDLYNILSAQTKIALGAHDIDHIEGNVNLRLTDGSEKFVPLGQSEPKPVQPGEYSYIDDSNEIICHLEIRQIDKTKVTEETKNIYFIVQGNEETSDEYVLDTANQLIELISKYCGGQGTIIS